MDADIVVFDPETMGDFGTYDKPKQPAVGMQSLVVNGQLVVRKGRMILKAGLGQPIRRKAQVRT